jgi:hypothetical protein
MEDQMDWKDDESPRKLEEALKNGKVEESEGLISSLLAGLEKMPRRVDRKVARDVLATLRTFARFDALFKVAEKFKSGGQNDPKVRCQLAQARIETGEMTAAIEDLFALKQELEEEKAKADHDPLEIKEIDYNLGEAIGLIGRAYKQLYVNAGPRTVEPRKEDLNRSLQHYNMAYRERLGEYLWHGINYVALLTHAERVVKNASNISSPKAEKHAQSILRALEDKEENKSLAPWDAAIRAEAFLALGKNPEAVDACKVYLKTKGLDAFQVQSTRRQFVELWQLNENEYPGSHILPMMTARYAELGGGISKVDLTAVIAQDLETVWNDTGYKSVEWLLQAVASTRCVARLGPSKLKGLGSGFLVDGAWIDQGWSDRKLLLTNAHVCTNDPGIQAQPPYPRGADENTATFMGSFAEGTRPIEVNVNKVLWTSPPSELDASLLEIADIPQAAEKTRLLREIPSVERWPEKRVNILGHPMGLNLQISLQDNHLVSVGERYLHYQTPTDPGSSGSPIFSQDWQLVGIHHSASREMQANEGIRIDRILEEIRKALLP